MQRMSPGQRQNPKEANSSQKNAPTVTEARCAVTAVFLSTGTILNMDVVSPRPVNAVPFIISDSWFSKEGARANVSPLTVHFLSDFSTHCRLKSGQVSSLRSVPAVCDRERPVIKGVGTFWVTVRPTHPTLDGM